MENDSRLEAMEEKLEALEGRLLALEGSMKVVRDLLIESDFVGEMRAGLALVRRFREERARKPALTGTDLARELLANLLQHERDNPASEATVTYFGQFFVVDLAAPELQKYMQQNLWDTKKILRAARVTIKPDQSLRKTMGWERGPKDIPERFVVLKPNV